MPLPPETVGDPDQAFEAVLLEALAPLRAYCAHLAGNRFDADDIASETVVGALRYREAYDPGLPIMPWLRRSATRIAWNAKRTARQMSPWPEESDFEDLARRGDGAEGHHSDAFADEQVEAALSALTRAQREAIVLWGALDCGTGEIAEELKVSVPAAESLLRRARSSFRRAYRAPERSWLGGLAALSAGVGALGRRLAQAVVHPGARVAALGPQHATHPLGHGLVVLLGRLSSVM